MTKTRPQPPPPAPPPPVTAEPSSTPPPSTLAPETAGKILAADLANLIRKTKSGRPLSKYERDLVKQATATAATPGAPREQPPQGSPSSTTAPPSPEALAERLLLEGHTAEAAERALVPLYPRGDPRKAIRAAVARFEAAARDPEAAAVGWALRSTRELYRLMLARGDFEGALRAVRQLVDIATRKKPATKEATDIDI